jgi:hypothetical protein
MKPALVLFGLFAALIMSSATSCNSDTMGIYGNQWKKLGNYGKIY